MKNFITNNVKHLVPFLEIEAIPYEVIQDGWKVKIPYSTEQDLFDLGYNFYDYLNKLKKQLSIKQKRKTV
jgi:hypothetical protein